jgi:hypothetical protein
VYKTYCAPDADWHAYDEIDDDTDGPSLEGSGDGDDY